MAITYHASIEDSEGIKKDFLELSKDIFRIIEFTEDMNTIRIEKIAMVIKLNKLVDEMLILLKKLKELVPRANYDKSQQEFEIMEIEKELSIIEDQVSKALTNI